MAGTSVAREWTRSLAASASTRELNSSKGELAVDVEPGRRAELAADRRGGRTLTATMRLDSTPAAVLGFCMVCLSAGDELPSLCASRGALGKASRTRWLCHADERNHDWRDDGRRACARPRGEPGGAFGVGSWSMASRARRRSSVC